MAIDRKAAQADNEVADELTGEELSWGDMPIDNSDLDDHGDEDSSTEDDSAPTDEEIAEGADDGASADDADPNADGQGADEVDGKVDSKAPAGAKPVAPAGIEQPAPTPTPTPQAPASVPEQTQRAPHFHEMVAQNYDAVVDHVAELPAMKLSATEAEGFDPAVVKIIERQTAKAYVQATSTFSQLLVNTLPQVIQNVVAVQGQAGNHETEFYGAYPGFDPKEHGPKLGQIAAFVRHQNPGLDRKQLSDKIAATGYAMLGVTPGTPAPTGGRPAVKPGTPKVIKQQAFAPAGRAPAAAGSRRPAGAPGKTDPLIDVNNMLRANADMDD